MSNSKSETRTCGTAASSWRENPVKEADALNLLASPLCPSDPDILNIQSAAPDSQTQGFCCSGFL